MKRFMMKIVMMGLILSSLAVPTKKAEAGVVLISGGAAVGGVVAILGGAGLSGFSFLNYMFCGFSPTKEKEVKCNTQSFIGLALGAGLILLDESGIEKEFQTIPSYLLEEIKAQSIAKAQTVEADKDGAKFVVFSDSEVDELFEMADELTSNDELIRLRSILTAPH